MTELQILSAVKNNNGCMEYIALLNLNATDVNQDSRADEARIEQMINKKLLKGKTEAFATIAITKEGRLYLQNAYYLEEEKKKLAEEAAQNAAKKKRYDWKFAIVGALIAGAIGFIFDLIIFLLK